MPNVWRPKTASHQHARIFYFQRATKAVSVDWSCPQVEALLPRSAAKAQALNALNAVSIRKSEAKARSGSLWEFLGIYYVSQASLNRWTEVGVEQV